MIEFLWKLIYNIIFVQLGKIFYYEQIFFNEKVRESHRFRKRVFSDLKKIISFFKPDDKILLIHSSSVGEFEQAKPIVEIIKREKPDIKIVCSFFSPSGYNAGKKYKEINGIILLPIDTYRRMRKFIKILKPNFIFFMRYDLWPNLIWRAKKYNTKIFIINGTIRETSRRGKKNIILTSFFKSFYKYVDLVFTISQADSGRYSTIIDSEKITVTGDTRYDIVHQKVMNADFSHRIFNVFKLQKNKIFIAGSTYEDEEKILIPAIKTVKTKIAGFTAVIVPHELKPAGLLKLENICRENNLSFCRESLILSSDEYMSNDIIIFDKMGFLYQLYKIASIAYVGGGFHGSIHSVMEPAVFGIPIIFGPSYRNSYEAIQLVERKGAAVFRNSKEGSDILTDFFLNANSPYLGYGKAAEKLISENLGVGKKIFNYLKKYL